YSLAVFDDGRGAALYAGGGFSTPRAAGAGGIARWGGAKWSAGGGGGSGGLEYVAALLGGDDRTGACPCAPGGFAAAGRTPANNIARWDGSAWEALGTGTGALVESLAVLHGGRPGAVLYAGGFFHSAGGADAERIAAWDGAEWSAVTRPLPFA